MAKTVSKRGNPVATGTATSPEERQRMIAEAAYFRALQRGFSGGDSVEDWLAAEREIDARLLRSRRELKQQTVPALPAHAPGQGAAPRPVISSH
jgi:hypothetical protein